MTNLTREADNHGVSPRGKVTCTHAGQSQRWNHANAIEKAGLLASKIISGKNSALTADWLPHFGIMEKVLIIAT